MTPYNPVLESQLSVAISSPSVEEASCAAIAVLTAAVFSLSTLLAAAVTTS